MEEAQIREALNVHWHASAAGEVNGFSRLCDAVTGQTFE